MPFGEIAEEIVGGLFRFISQVFIEIILEILIKGPGYFIARQFSKNVEPDGFIVILIGLLFWVVVGGCAYALYEGLFT